VLVELVVPDVDVVPVVDVPLVDVVAVFVTGGPPPVSVAVVPVVLVVDGCVSVAALSSFGPRLQATQSERMAMAVMTPRMRM
jgi:hypothetical protein